MLIFECQRRFKVKLIPRSSSPPKVFRKLVFCCGCVIHRVVDLVCELGPESRSLLTPSQDVIALVYREKVQTAHLEERYGILRAPFGPDVASAVKVFRVVSGSGTEGNKLGNQVQFLVRELDTTGQDVVILVVEVDSRVKRQVVVRKLIIGGGRCSRGSRIHEA